MNPQNEMNSIEELVAGGWERLILATRKFHSMIWLGFLLASLFLFLTWMPPPLRTIIWHGLVARGLLSGMLLLFSFLAISLVWSVGQRVDVWVFLYFNLRGPRPAWLDRTMLAFTQAGSGIAGVGLGVVLLLARESLVAYELILGTLMLWIVVELMKASVRRSRPMVRVSEARVVGNLARGRSFPSGHTSQAFFMATLLAPYFHASAWLVVLIYALAMWVGVTRMYVGAHYPRDVLAGAILGSIWGFVGVLVNGYLLKGM